MKMIGNVSDWLSYAGGALIKVADSAGSTVVSVWIEGQKRPQTRQFRNSNLPIDSVYGSTYNRVCVSH